MSAYTAHLHMETGAPFAQIVLQPLGRDHVDRVEFDVIHDDRTKMRYNAVLPYQTAGEFKRKTHHLITALYTGRHGDFRAYAVSLWSRALTPSDRKSVV